MPAPLIVPPAACRLFFWVPTTCHILTSLEEVFLSCTFSCFIHLEFLLLPPPLDSLYLEHIPATYRRRSPRLCTWAWEVLPPGLSLTADSGINLPPLLDAGGLTYLPGCALCISPACLGADFYLSELPLSWVHWVWEAGGGCFCLGDTWEGYSPLSLWEDSPSRGRRSVQVLGGLTCLPTMGEEGLCCILLPACARLLLPACSLGDSASPGVLLLGLLPLLDGEGSACLLPGFS